MVRNIVLIYPCSRRYSGFLSTHRMPGLVTSHSGLSILKQVLEREGVSARVYDEQITPFTEELVDGADLVGISIQTSWARQGYRIARDVRRLGIPVVMGGVHATLNPDEAIEHADYVVRGEGEKTLPELVRALSTGVGLDDILGLSYWHDGKPQHNPGRPQMSNEELDRVPWPRLDLIEGFADPLRYPLTRAVHFTMLTRGCDQACTYCSITRVFGRALRHRSVKGIIEELGSRFDPKRQHLFFMDDSLAVDTDFLKEVLTAMLRERLVPRNGWHSQMRAEVANDPELLRLMKETKCLFVTCGFESVNERSLRALGKGQTPDDVRRGIALLREHGIIVNGFFMFGTDHDRPGAMAETVKFAKSSGCMLAGFMPLTPFPGTPAYTVLDREGRIFTRDWELYDVQHVVFRPKHMSAFDLYWKTLSCYPAFYTPDYYLRHGLTAIERRVSPLVAAIGVAWPVVKNLCWSREVVANLDYMRALRELGEGQRDRGFSDVGGGLWLKDVVSGRTVRRLASRRRAPRHHPSDVPTPKQAA